MSAWAKPGVKCVCIKRSIWVPTGGAPKQFDNTCPVYGGVYTIRTAKWSSGGIYLRFVEIVNPIYPYADGPSEKQFRLAGNFRPLITRTQSEDVALFRNLLVTEGADA
jgi:hypothetical protein